MATLVPEQLIAPYTLKIPHLLPGSRTQEMQNWQALQTWANAFIQFSDISTDQLFLARNPLTLPPDGETIAWTQSDVLRQSGTSIALQSTVLGGLPSITTDGNYAISAGFSLSSGSVSVVLPEIAIAAGVPGMSTLAVASTKIPSASDMYLSAAVTSFLPTGAVIAISIFDDNAVTFTGVSVNALIQRLS